jgi:hypothetical protein
MSEHLEHLKEREHDLELQREKLQREIERRAERLAELRKEQDKARERTKAKAERERELEKAIAEATEDALWKKRACIDDCTTWLGLKLTILTVGARTSWVAEVSSADRTSHADDCGDKLSQAELFHLFQIGQGNPANPPGTGTHEGICDNDIATITGRSIGSDLPPWMWGLDLGDGPGFEREAERLGFKLVRAYPDEPWHVNLTADPTPVLKRLDAF